MAIACKTAQVPGLSGVVTVAHGLAESPKAIIFFGIGATTAGSWTVDAHQGIGFWTPGDGGKSVATHGVDGQGTSVEEHTRYNDFVTLLYDAASRFTVTVDATNVYLTFPSTPNYPNARIGMIVIAGPNVQAKLIRQTLKTTTGNQSVSGVGFQPDVTFFVHAGDADTDEATGDFGSRIGFGWMCADGTQGQGSTTATNGVTTTAAGRRVSTGACLQGINAAGTVQFGATFTSMDADGFSINYATAAANAAPYYALCLKGVTAKAISVAKKNGTGSQSITTIGFPPQLMMFLGVNSGDGTSASNGGLSIGAATGTGSGGRFSTAFQMRNGLTTSDDNSYYATHAVSIAAFGTSQALAGEADVSGFTSNGCTLNWVTNDTGTAPIFMLGLRVPDWGAVLGDLAAASDAIARATADARSLADTAGASDAVARTAGASRSPSDSAPGSDAVGGVAAHPRAISDAVAGTDALVRATADARSIADTAGATDALTDAISHPRAISDTAPAVDGISRAAAEARAVADSAPASEAVARSEASARLVSDVGAASDATSSQGAYGRSLGDPAPSVDSMTAGHATTSPLADSAPSSDAIGRAVGSVRSASDSAPSSEDITSARAFGRRPSDAAPATDVLARIFAGIRSASDPAPSADALAFRIAFMRALADAVSGSDSLGGIAHHEIARALSDSAPSSSLIARAVAAARSLTDTAPSSGTAGGFVPVPYVSEPTDAVLAPSATDADVFANRTDARIAGSETDLELEGSATGAVLVASRTTYEVFRGGEGDPSGFGEGGFGEGGFGE